MSLNGFIQTIKSPTRITPHSETLIYLIFSNKPETLNSNNVLPCSLSDHDAIYCSRKMHNNKKPSETIFCRDYKNYTAESLKDDLKNTDFSTVYMEENPNNSWKNLKNILLKTFNKHAPIISKRVKGKKSPWLTTSIKKEINSRDLLHRKFWKSRCQTDYDTYRIQRNKVNVIVRKAKNKHYKSMLNESSNDPRRFWRTLKQIFPVKETVTNAKSFFINGVLESKPARIASIFCKFFTNMAVKVKATSIRLKDVYSVDQKHTQHSASKKS